MTKGTLMYLLDTDIVIWVLKGEKKLVSFLDRLVLTEETGISTITIAEVYKNIRSSEISTAEDFSSHQSVIPVSSEIAQAAGFYWQMFHKQIANCSLTDCIIAATAKLSQSPLLTLNTRHFLMTDIEAINPLK